MSTSAATGGSADAPRDAELLASPVRDFELVVSGNESSAVVAVRGEVDLSTAPELEQQLLQLVDTGVLHIDIDLEEMPFIDSTGLSALVAALRRTKELEGRTIVLSSPTPSTRRVLEISGVAEVFSIR